VSARTRGVTRAAKRATARLAENCRKGGPLYARNARAVAQVSRTGKWLLHALSALDRERKSSANSAAQPKG
jgi:hypothetical protein